MLVRQKNRRFSIDFFCWKKKFLLEKNVVGENFAHKWIFLCRYPIWRKFTTVTVVDLSDGASSKEQRTKGNNFFDETSFVKVLVFLLICVEKHLCCFVKKFPHNILHSLIRDLPFWKSLISDRRFQKIKFLNFEWFEKVQIPKLCWANVGYYGEIGRTDDLTFFWQLQY